MRGKRVARDGEGRVADLQTMMERRFWPEVKKLEVPGWRSAALYLSIMLMALHTPEFASKPWSRRGPEISDFWDDGSDVLNETTTSTRETVVSAAFNEQRARFILCHDSAKTVESIGEGRKGTGRPCGHWRSSGRRLLKLRSQ
ncbi:hypothetical protein EDD85DRAFT_786921 [Armillaria nabsnona]|nr:hypothetical protein EDD85DRAFT_786921 [Armillaria nabsnona]